MGRRGVSFTVSAVTVAVLVCAAVAVALLGRDGGEPLRERATTATATVARAAQGPPETTARRCVAERPFTPDRIAVTGLVDAAVVPVPRDARGVTGVLPLTDKHRFAWDPSPGVLPGSARGNVLLNTHTWSDGTALGNELLDGLDIGDRIVLRGDAQVQCYEVHERTEVRADTRFPDYYDTEGRHQVAIVVCSGERTGPGEWTHRTLWFARAVGSGGG